MSNQNSGSSNNLARSFQASNATSRMSQSRALDQDIALKIRGPAYFSLPLSEQQRYHQFAMMVKNYSTSFISQEDYKKSSFPKKCLTGFLLCYAGFVLHMRY